MKTSVPLFRSRSTISSLTRLRSSLRLGVAGLVIGGALAVACPAHAATTLFYDGDGDNTNTVFSTSGTWSTSAVAWSASSTAQTTNSDIVWPNDANVGSGTGDIANFGASGIAAPTAPVTVTLGSSILAGGITVSSAFSQNLLITAGSNNYTINIGTTGIGTNQGTTATTTIDAVITGTQGLLKINNGILILARDSTYTGVNIVKGLSGSSNGGVLQVGNGGTTGSLDTGSVQFQASGTQSGASTVRFDQSGDQTVVNNFDLSNTNNTATTVASVGGIIAQIGGGKLTLSGTVNLAAEAGLNPTVTYNIGRTSTIPVDTEVSGAISGTGKVAKTGAGVLLLSNTSNTYSGGTAVSAGTLQAKTPGSLPGYTTAGSVVATATGTVAVNVGGTGEFTSANVDSLLANATFASGTAVGFDTTDGNFTYATNITGALGVTKLGTNALTLSGTNTYTGSTNLLGGVTLIGTDSVGSATSSNLTSGAFGTGALVVNGASVEVPSGVTSRTVGNAITLSGNMTIASAGTTDAALTFTGPVSVSLSSRTITSAANSDVTFSGVISGTHTLTVNDSSSTGRIIFSGANTYGSATLPTQLTQGTLVVANTSGSATGASTVNVSSGGILSGGSGAANTGATQTAGGASRATYTQGVLGIVSGTVNVASGGRLAPGNASVGTLTVGALTLNTGATATYEFNGTANDFVSVTGALTLATGTTVAVTLLQEGTATAFATTGVYNLFSYGTGSTVDTTGLSVANAQGGVNYSFFNDTTDGLIQLDITPVPEPSTWMIGFLSVGALGISLRRRMGSSSARPRA